MAIFFNDNHLKCDICHNDLLYERTLSRYTKDEHGEYAKKVVFQQLVCNECGNVVVKDMEHK